MTQRKAGSVAKRVPILLLVVTVFLIISCGQAEKVVDQARSRLGDTPPPTPTAEKAVTLPGTPVLVPNLDPDLPPSFDPTHHCDLEVVCESIPTVKTFIVNTTDDEAEEEGATLGDGFCLTASGTCTLRAAIQEANLLVPRHAYIPLPSGTYGLTIAADPNVANVPCIVGATCVVGGNEDSAALGDLDITGNVCIRGNDRDATIITAINSTVGRVFDVGSGAQACLVNLTVTNGYAPPWIGVDPINASIVLPYCGIEANPDDCDGGGIRNNGDLHLNYVV